DRAGRPGSRCKADDNRGRAGSREIIRPGIGELDALRQRGQGQAQAQAAHVVLHRGQRPHDAGGRGLVGGQRGGVGVDGVPGAQVARRLDGQRVAHGRA
nr:hypothetical protein [Tanacetum cinerariifolium]